MQNSNFAAWYLLIWPNCELQVDDLRHLCLFGDSVDSAAGWWWHVDVVCVASAGNTDDIYTATSLTGGVNTAIYFTLENKVLMKYWTWKNNAVSEYLGYYMRRNFIMSTDHLALLGYWNVAVIMVLVGSYNGKRRSV